MNERTFEEVVKSIEMSEKDVDKILKAAKLQRYPRMSDTRFEIICAMVVFIILVVMFFGFMAITIIWG
jgi:t-SNARE complex subunit (syntaxin)